jgi:DNA repair exonuclease SbcCD ATPase subunit
LQQIGKHLDTTRIVKFAKFVQYFLHKLGFQIIMSSHWEVMSDCADVAYSVELDDSVSRVSKEK